MHDGTKDTYENVKGRVGWLLNRFPELRDSDKKLYLAFLHHFTNFPEKLNTSNQPWGFFKDFFLDDNSPHFNTIRRIRAKYQQQGMYPSSEQIKAERDAREEESTDYFGKL